MSNEIFDKTTDALSTSLNFRLLRNNVINSNVANAETPGYHAKKVEFEGALKRAIEMENMKGMSNQHPDHFALGPGSIGRAQADVYDDPDINVTNDKNTVDLEKEMAALAENTIMYRTAVELINRKLAQMKYAVTEGGR